MLLDNGNVDDIHGLVNFSPLFDEGLIIASFIMLNTVQRLKADQ